MPAECRCSGSDSAYGSCKSKRQTARLAEDKEADERLLACRQRLALLKERHANRERYEAIRDSFDARMVALVPER